MRVSKSTLFYCNDFVSKGLAFKKDYQCALESNVTTVHQCQGSWPKMIDKPSKDKWHANWLGVNTDLLHPGFGYGHSQVHPWYHKTLSLEGLTAACSKEGILGNSDQGQERNQQAPYVKVSSEWKPRSPKRSSWPVQFRHFSHLWNDLLVLTIEFSQISYPSSKKQKTSWAHWACSQILTLRSEKSEARVRSLSLNIYNWE